MCRWGCTTTSTTYMCKFCGTRYCKECLRGDFTGLMLEATRCRICNQKKCQGVRVEFKEVASKESTSPKGSKSAPATARGKSSAKSEKSTKSGKKKKKKR